MGKGSKLVDKTNSRTTLPIVYYALIASTLIMVLYFMIEVCSRKLISDSSGTIFENPEEASDPEGGCKIGTESANSKRLGA